MTIHIHFGACSQGSIFKSSAGLSGLCNRSLPTENRTCLFAHLGIPLGLLFPVHEHGKVNNVIAFSDQSLSSLCSIMMPGHIYVEPEKKRFEPCNQEQLKDIPGSRVLQSTKKADENEREEHGR